VTKSGDGDGAPTPSAPSIDAFLREPTRRIADWRSLWERDLAFPIRSERGIAGRALVLLKRLLRPLVTVPQNDLWERQRVFNLILLEHLERQDATHRELEARVRHLEAFLKEGLDEVMRHNDALFTRVDQKLDRYRREARDLSGHLQAALARADEEPVSGLRRGLAEESYLRFEARYRGTPEEIAARLEGYLPLLEDRAVVLDLGCGRGEALEVLRDAGHDVRGVDSSAEMVRICRERGLDVVEGDLLEALAAEPAESLDAVVSFHVIEHLAATDVDRLVHLAWRALRRGGVLLFETPSPLSLLVGGSRFWVDPTHVRPVHPASLRHAFESAGFCDVERLDRNPFPEEERLPELDLEAFTSEELRTLADRVNRLRDRLDDLLFGFQDYALIGMK
jgi:O-antigen chain-terminating methyltransferase